jgi:ABC-type Zn2+ transport system substrate-binding protein/surface adhesin
MLRFLTARRTAIRAAVILIAVAVVCCSIASKGLAAEMFDSDQPPHHGLVMGHHHGHDHHHDDDDQDDGTHKGGAALAHVHFEAYLQTPSTLTLKVTESEIIVSRPATLALNVRVLYERPPKAVR